MSAINFGLGIQERSNPSVARFERLKLILMKELRVALPAIVKSFDADTQTVTVIVTTNERVMFNTPSDTVPLPISLQTQTMQRAVLEKVPIFISNGGGLNLTFPIKEGDECFVLFADTEIDIWFQNGGLNNNPIDDRRHSTSDGIAIFGVRSSPHVLGDYSTDSAQLRTDDGETVIDIKDGQITVTADTVTVNAMTATVTASGTATISGETSVKLGSSTHLHDFLNHEHTGVATGAGISGGVNPVGP